VCRGFKCIPNPSMRTACDCPGPHCREDIEFDAETKRPFTVMCDHIQCDPWAGIRYELIRARARNHITDETFIQYYKSKILP